MSASLADFTAPQHVVTGPIIDGRADDGNEGEPLSVWLGAFEEAERETEQARFIGEQSRDYVDHAQWTAAELKVLRDRGQPPSVDNVIKEKIELLRGLERRGRSDPKAFPRTPTEDNRADAATQALRFCADDNRFDVVRSSVYDNMLVEGYGGCEVIVRPERSRQALSLSTAMTQPGYKVVVNHIPWDRLFHDPHSRHPGFSDAQYLGCVIWSDYDEARRMYPGSDDVLTDTFNGATASTTYDDKPSIWADPKRRRVRLVQMWRKHGDDWWSSTFTRGGFVELPAVSPYLDREGNPTCPLIMRSCYVDRHNNRYGVVRGLIPRQDEINKRTSKLMHSLNTNRIRMEEGAVADVDALRAEAAKPDGIMVYNRGFELAIEKDQAEIQGHFEMLQHAIQRMNVSGPNASMAGKDPRDQSGRAIIAQQSGGQVANEPVADELRQWTHKVYEAMWMRIRQFWTGPKWIRVTDDQRNVQFVGLNRPVTFGDKLKQMPPDQMQAVAQRFGLTPGDPRLSMPTGEVENDIGDMDVDITVEEGPDVPTMAAENWQAFQQLPESVLAQYPPEFFIEANPAIRDKDKFVKMLEQHQAAQAQAAQQQHAAQQAMQQAQVSKVQSDAQLAQARAADVGAQRVERLHGIASDHAEMIHQPVVPGVGVVAPDINPLLQPPQPQTPPQPLGAQP